MLKYLFVFCLFFNLFFAGACRAEEWHIPKQPWTYSGIKVPLIDHTLWKNWDRNARYHFVGGFLTGLIFGATQSVGQDFFTQIGGMTINEVLDALDDYYQEHPDDGSTVYSVILKVIPRNRTQD